MRMWMVPPIIMCLNHLLGEHNEIHKMKGHLEHGRRLGKFKTDGLFDPSKAIQRHEELIREMVRRGGNHYSPLDSFPSSEQGTIDFLRNLKDLIGRCSNCKSRAIQFGDREIISILLEL